MNGFREVTFWLLLLGTTEFLQSGSPRSGLFGLVGVAAFLAFAVSNLGKLNSMGLSYAAWCPVRTTVWVVAVSVGLSAGGATSAIVAGIGRHLLLSDDWRLILLQVTIGPVLEELVFRGYLFAFLAWCVNRVFPDKYGSWITVLITAATFSASHLGRPGADWLQFTAIGSTGFLYGWIRQRSCSSAPAALAHAAYNLSLYCGSFVWTRGVQ